MPYRNGTGPMGRGPMSGRGMGRCGGGRGQGPGYGRGPGMGRRAGAAWRGGDALPQDDVDALNARVEELERKLADKN